MHRRTLSEFPYPSQSGTKFIIFIQSHDLHGQYSTSGSMYTSFPVRSIDPAEKFKARPVACVHCWIIGRWFAITWTRMDETYQIPRDSTTQPHVNQRYVLQIALFCFLVKKLCRAMMHQGRYGYPHQKQWVGITKFCGVTRTFSKEMSKCTMPYACRCSTAEVSQSRQWTWRKFTHTIYSCEADTNQRLVSWTRSGRFAGWEFACTSCVRWWWCAFSYSDVKGSEVSCRSPQARVFLYFKQIYASISLDLEYVPCILCDLSEKW